MIKCFLPIFFVISLCVDAQDFKVKDPINTGVNMTVAILEVDSNIAIGDTIVALYKVDDDLHVGGLTVWNGTRLAIALCKASASFSGTITPVFPSTIVSLIPPQSVPITGTPAIIASRTTSPNPSFSPRDVVFEGNINNSA